MTCPLCGSSEARRNKRQYTTPLERQVLGVSQYNYIECVCGMWHSDVEQDEGFYSKEYRLTRRPHSTKVTTANLEEEARRADELAEYLIGKIEIPKNIMDFGSSTGTLLSKLHSLYGCLVTGIELSEEFRSYSRLQGIRTEAHLTNLSRKETFDLITIIHTLEHVFHPLELLGQFRERLDGYLLVQVPRLVFGYAHPLVFDDITLQRMLTRAGFEILDLDTTKDLTALCRKENHATQFQ